ncbi:hypothetical protein CCR75_000816 [Bremia lactucae]|uniref:Protein MON2 homolog n=1 Tax=Bremia lactucae TaxID=4779 RepID=A0A976FGL4_BRELC|nr:hypothetical protein CCR75_000816 [Bremia lactucae]
MDFLRQVATDLHALRTEAKRKYPVVKEAVDRALETLPSLQQQYAALVRVEKQAPGPGHCLFQSDSVLRPFLLACNHTNASHKILLLAFSSIQRLVSWDAIAPASVSSILRVLQIQAEKTTYADVQVKLLQTLLQLMTLAYEETKNREMCADGMVVERHVIGNEEVVMQAIWICVYLHASSSSASSLVGNTAAMTIRQIVSLAFRHVDASADAKHVSVLLFQDLCAMSRDEQGLYVKRTLMSSMSAALGVELLETIITSYYAYFRLDLELRAVLKQQMTRVVQSVLESGCHERHGGGTVGSGIMGPTHSSITTSTITGTATLSFPLLVRGMRLASTLLSHFADCLDRECTFILHILLEIIATGTYTAVDTSSKSSLALIKTVDSKFHATNAIATFKDAKQLLVSSSSANTFHASVNYVTWPVLLSLEVLNRICLEPTMVAAMVQSSDSVLVAMIRTTSSVILTSTPLDFRPQGVEMRSGLELLNDHETPVLQPFYMAIRVAASCQCNMTAAVLELSRDTCQEAMCEQLASTCVAVIAPAVMQSMNCVVRYCREVEVVSMALKSYHVLATVASRLRTHMESSRARKTWGKPMDDIVLTCLRALCGFSFPLPDGICGNGKGGVSSPKNASELIEDSGSEDGESCNVVITWREVQAMKALCGAAHVMENELSQHEWCILLEAFEIIVGLTDLKLKHGQQKLPSKSYRISTFRVENEDVEQQLYMLGTSLIEFFRNAVKLEQEAVTILLDAVRRVSWTQVGLPIPRQDIAIDIDAKTTLRPESLHQDDNDAFQVVSTHQMRIYQSYLGVGLTGTGSFVPCFALRMLTQLAGSDTRCFQLVMHELVLMSTFRPQLPFQASQFPQLDQFQVFTTDCILQLMQTALQQSSHSVSLVKTHKSSPVDIREALEWDQHELLAPLVNLARSDQKDRLFTGLLELLNACGHLIKAGWPLIFAAIQEACEKGDAKTQVVAFKCLRVIVDDFMVALPSAYLGDCIQCIGRFGSQAKDVNISLTAVNELWTVADVLGKPMKLNVTTSRHDQWGSIFTEFSHVALDSRAEVRNSALNSLFGTAVTYGSQFELKEWQFFMNSTVLPLATKFCETTSSTTCTESFLQHHSRDSPEKQWNESRVLLLTGISRVLETNGPFLLQFTSWFESMWHDLLYHVAKNAAFGVPHEVVLAAIKTLQTLLQVSSAGDLDLLAQSQPVRAGVGMRVVGGALLSSSMPVSAHVTNRRPTSLYRDPALWNEAFSTLLHLCDERQLAALQDKEHVRLWCEDDEQEIASAVVAVLVALYLQAKDFEFKERTEAVEKMLHVFRVLVFRHVLEPLSTIKITMITSTSLQSRVLNAFEACQSFASHPAVHCIVLDQVIEYIQESSKKELVFFTRHALTTLGKLYVRVSMEARNDRFLAILFCIQPFLPCARVSCSSLCNEFETAAQKARTQLWKYALKVLVLLISNGLVAVRLAEACWRPLLATIVAFVEPQSGNFPSCVQSEEDQVVVLSLLECIVNSFTKLLRESDEHIQKHSRAFLHELVAVLCSGINAVHYDKLMLQCCVGQLTTLCLQVLDKDMALFLQKQFVTCCKMAMQHFMTFENGFDSTILMKNKDIVAAQETVVVLLTSILEAALPRSCVLELYSSLCGCITSSDEEVRQWVQRLLLRLEDDSLVVLGMK